MELFFYIASYDNWHESKQFPIGFFEALRKSGMDIDVFDCNDPPRRAFLCNKQDIEFWLENLGQNWSRWLFAKKKNKEKFNVTIQLVNRNIEAVKSRGDYHCLYGSIKTDSIDNIKSFWELLCIRLSPFHGFLDTLSQYNRRAHKIRSDGSIEKITGWYRQFLPGFFAYNYFGEVYKTKWGKEVIVALPSDPVKDFHKGIFVWAPSGLRENNHCIPVYTEEDRDILERIGIEKFRLPDRFTVDKNAPNLEAFLAQLH